MNCWSSSSARVRPSWLWAASAPDRFLRDSAACRWAFPGGTGFEDDISSSDKMIDWSLEDVSERMNVPLPSGNAVWCASESRVRRAASRDFLPVARGGGPAAQADQRSAPIIHLHRPYRESSISLVQCARIPLDLAEGTKSSHGVLSGATPLRCVISTSTATTSGPTGCIMITPNEAVLDTDIVRGKTTADGIPTRWMPRSVDEVLASPASMIYQTFEEVIDAFTAVVPRSKHFLAILCMTQSLLPCATNLLLRTRARSLAVRQAVMVDEVLCLCVLSMVLLPMPETSPFFNFLNELGAIEPPSWLHCQIVEAIKMALQGRTGLQKVCSLRPALRSVGAVWLILS